MQEELCVFESQKSLVEQMYLPVYQDRLKISGPKIVMQQTLPSKNNVQEIPTELIKTEHPLKQGKSLEESVIQFEESHSSKPPRQQSQPENNMSQFDLNINQVLEPCKICFQDYAETELIAKLSCQHKFCNDCLREYLIEKVRTAQVLEIPCPQCSVQFNEQQIQEMLDKKWFEKYKRFYHKEKINLNKNVRWCPRVNCDNYVIGTGQKKLKCECGQEICFDCGNAYHEKLNCEQAQDQTYLLARKQHQIYDCPRCRSPIQKRSGCNHMSCYTCHYQFCWLCRGSYSQYHYVVFNIFGCVIPGGQGLTVEPFENPTLLRIMMVIPKLILTLLIIIGLLIVLPFIGLFFVIKTPYLIFKKTCDCKLRRYDGCEYFLLWLSFFFLGILLMPLTISVYIIISPCLLINLIMEMI